MRHQNQYKQTNTIKRQVQSIKQIFSLSANPQNSPFKTPKKEPIEIAEEAESSKKQKFSMSELCYSFMTKFSDNPEKPVIFLTKDLVDDFSVKQRRIYDLMNIMEGLKCVKRLSKGKYQWKGIDNNSADNVKSEKGQSNSLRYIAARVKYLIMNAKNPLSFTEIYDQLFEEDNKNRSKQINPISLRRRIYECCKILTMMELIIKIDKKYIWNHEKINISVMSQNKMQFPIRRARRITLNQKELIKEIIKRYKTDNQINEFITKLNAARKQQLQTTIKKQEN